MVNCYPYIKLKRLHLT